MFSNCPDLGFWGKETQKFLVKRTPGRGEKKHAVVNTKKKIGFVGKALLPGMEVSG